MKANLTNRISDYVVKYYNEGEEVREKFFPSLEDALSAFNTLTEKYDFVRVVNETMLFGKTKDKITMFI